MTRSLPRLTGAVTAIVVGLSALAACADGTDPGDGRADQVRAAAIDAGLDGDVADFLALASRGATATYQATYPGPAPDSSIVVANRPPDRRIDIVVGDVVTEVRIVLDGEAFRCGRNADAQRIEACERTDAFIEAPGLFDDAALDRLTGSLVARSEDFTFRIETMPTAGVEATCLVTEIRAGRGRPDLGDRGTICVSDEGALLRVDQADESLEATDYATKIPDNTFVRPDRQD